MQAHDGIKNFDKSNPKQTIISSVKTAYGLSLAAGGITAGAWFMGGDKDPMGVEQDIRQTFIAESLCQFSDRISRPIKAAIVYPKGH